MQNELGLALRLARVAAGKTQWQVARNIGLHPSVLNFIERGQRRPRIDLLRKIAGELSASAPRSGVASIVFREAGKIIEDALEQ